MYYVWNKDATMLLGIFPDYPSAEAYAAANSLPTTCIVRSSSSPDVGTDDE